MKPLLHILLIPLLTVLTNYATSQQWADKANTLSCCDSTHCAIVHSMVVYKGELFEAGNYLGINKVCHSIVKWDGEYYKPADSAYMGNIFTMAVYKGELYAGGSCIGGIMKWDGKRWSVVGGGISNIVLALEVYKGELYAGGLFDSAGGQRANNIAKWDGAKWSPVDSGITARGWGMAGRNNEVSSIVRCFAIYKDKLCAGGLFDQAGGVKANNIASWDGTKWDALGGGLSGVEDSAIYEICALHVFNGKLYSGGRYQSWRKVRPAYVFKWDGERRDTADANMHGIINTFIVDGNRLYAGGNFKTDKGLTNVTCWDGKHWSEVSFYEMDDGYSPSKEMLEIYKEQQQLRQNENMMNFYWYQ